MPPLAKLPWIACRVILASMVISFATPALAQEADWKSISLGEVSFQVPASWTVKRRVRDREVEFKSPDGRYELLAHWWFPDEPILGYDDIVAHRNISVDGRSATLVHSEFSDRTVLSLYFEDARSDQHTFVLKMEIADKNYARGSALLDELLARLKYAKKKSGVLERELHDGTVGQGRTETPDAPGIVYRDPEGGFSLRQPQRWRRSSAQRPGVRTFCFVSPDKQGLLLIAVLSATPEHSVADLTEEFERLYYQEYVVPESIEADDAKEIGGLSGQFVEAVGQVYSIEGVTLSFAKGRSWLFKAQAGGQGYVVATVHSENAAGTLKEALRDALDSLRTGAAVPTGFPVMSSAAPGKKVPLEPPKSAIDADPMVKNFGGDCRPVDLGAWDDATKSVLVGKKGARLEWVLACRNKAHLVFGLTFDFDPQGQTSDFFYPLYADLLKANGARPFALVAISDSLLIRVAGNGSTDLALDYVDLSPAEIAALSKIAAPLNRDRDH